jgi:hypothetical protein
VCRLFANHFASYHHVGPFEGLLRCHRLNETRVRILHAEHQQESQRREFSLDDLRTHSAA